MTGQMVNSQRRGRGGWVVYIYNAAVMIRDIDLSIIRDARQSAARIRVHVRRVCYRDILGGILLSRREH